MAQFNTNIVGYNKEEVEKYFFKLETEFTSILSQKKFELNQVQNKINQQQQENIKISQAIENEHKKKSDYLSYLKEELSNINASLEKNKEKANEEKSEALEALKKKKTELENEQKYIKQLKKELKAIKNRRRLLKQLYAEEEK